MPCGIWECGFSATRRRGSSSADGSCSPTRCSPPGSGRCAGSGRVPSARRLRRRRPRPHLAPARRPPAPALAAAPPARRPRRRAPRRRRVARAPRASAGWRSWPPARSSSTATCACSACPPRTAATDGARAPRPRPQAQAMGHVLEAGGTRVYASGDTDLFDGMGALGPLDVALLPVWGWGPTLGPGHLDPARAAVAVERLRPRVVVPVHWGSLAVDRADGVPGGPGARMRRLLWRTSPRAPSAASPSPAGDPSGARRPPAAGSGRGPMMRRPRWRPAGGCDEPARRRLDRPGDHRLPGAARGCPPGLDRAGRADGRGGRRGGGDRHHDRPPLAALGGPAGHGRGAGRRRRHVRGGPRGQRPVAAPGLPRADAGAARRDA